MERETRKPAAQAKREQERERFIRDALQKIPLPAFVPPSPEVLVHRRRVAAEIDAFREALGPAPFPVSDWIREDRDGREEDNG